MRENCEVSDLIDVVLVVLITDPLRDGSNKLGRECAESSDS